MSQARLAQTAEGKKAASERMWHGAATAAAVATLPSSGFGLWDGRSDENNWLTAYAADYLLARKEAGDAVPEAMLNQALNRLQSYLTDSQYGERWSSAPEHSRLAYQAYSAYVLARVGKAPLATLRLVWEQQADHARSGLPLLHLSLALSAMGMSRTPPRPSVGHWRPSAGTIISGITARRCAIRPLSSPCCASTSWLRSAGRPSVPRWPIPWLTVSGSAPRSGSPCCDSPASIRPSTGRPGWPPLWQWIPERFGSAAAGCPEALAASAVTNEGKGSSMCSAPWSVTPNRLLPG